MENCNMASEVFQIKELRKPNIFQRLFKQLPKENALIEVNNLLAKKRIQEISVSEISSIADHYGVNLQQVFQKNFLEMYAAQLKYALTDEKLSEDELNELKALKELLGLQQYQVNLIHEQLAGDIYRKQVVSTVEDGKITVDETKALKVLESELCISKDLETRISNQVKSLYVDKFVKGVVSQGSLSPQDERDLKQLAKNLNYDLSLSQSQLNTLSRLKMIWAIQNGELPIVDATINLYSGEKCYFSRPAKWYQYKTVTQRVNYSGLSTRIRICKGVSYRIGTVRPQRITSEVLAPVDAGMLYVTDRRIVLLGNRKTSTTRLNKIVSFTPYNDGVEIFKETGKSTIITIETDMELFHLLFSRVLRDC